MTLVRRARRVSLAPILLLSACSGGVLDPHGPVASAERTILFDALVIMLALIVPTIIGGLWVGWWFRAGNKGRARYLPHFAFSGRLEILIWSVPTLIIVFLGGLIWFGSHQLDPYRPLASTETPLEVQAVSLDWKWLFIYPDQGIASVNDLVVPEHRPVHLSITSASVMNTFWVPQLAGMIYAMNGMVTELNLAADHPGSFTGRSGDFSGDHFSDMHFTVRSVAQSGFTAWVDQARQAGDTLDRAAYQQLERQSVPDHPYTYRAVDPGLFKAIATQQIPAGPGPTTPSPAGIDVHPTTAEK